MENAEVDGAEIALLFQLGLMIREAARLEVVVESTSRHLEAELKPGSTGLAGAPLSRLLREARKIADKHSRIDDRQKSALLDLLDRVAKVAEARNAYVHGAWAADDDGTFLAVRGQRGQSEFAAHPVSLDQLKFMVVEIRDIVAGLQNWVVADLDKRDAAM